MANTPLPSSKKATIRNLNTLQDLLTECVEEGMLDLNSTYHNRILLLIDEAHLSDSLPELEEVIFQAKVLESDVDAWLASKGRTTLSLEWPST